MELTMASPLLLFLAGASAIIAAGTPSVVLNVKAKSGREGEGHTITLSDVQLQGSTPSVASPPTAPRQQCVAEFTLSPDGTLGIDDPLVCPTLTAAMKTWSLATDERLFESVSWTMALIDTKDGPRLGIPRHLLRSRDTVASPFMTYTDLKVVKPVAPTYPSAAKRNALTAVCTVDLVVDERGKVSAATARSDDQCDPVFHPAAERTLKRWKFRPYRIDGEPYESTYTVKLKFQMP